MAYILFTTILIVVLNIYPITVSRNAVTRAKESSILAKAEVIVSSMDSLEELTEESVRKTLAHMEDMAIDRILVINSDGRCVYDSAASDNVLGQYVLYPELVTAMEGNDVVRCTYTPAAFESFAAVPVLYRTSLGGAVYVMERDEEQAAVILSIQANIRRLSLGIGIGIILFTILFSLAFSRRIHTILGAIRIVREGEYSHKLEIDSRDELGELANEFNALTDRITSTEQMLRQFVSDASHELKTPLASITLLADSILQNRSVMDEETTMEFVQDIGNEAERLSRLANKLLSLTRLSSRTEEKYESVDLAETAKKVLRILRPLADTRNVCLEQTMEENCCVLAREDDMFQIIFNLAENGVKYNKEGGTLQILLFRRENQATLIVEDEGIGIPPEDRERIFERFYRVDKARSRAAGGTGLGLAIVKDTVEKYSGSIEVSGRENGGTRFTIHFPLMLGEAALQEEQL